jgi:AcrR family transcriptional regulator
LHSIVNDAKLHSVEESATGLERRMAETAERMKAVARRLTAERGLSGFTIDELCAEVGVSRRTFFNYFASKENAVLGLPARLDLSEPIARFLEGAQRREGGEPRTLSATLVDDFAALSIARWELLELTPEDVPLVVAAVDREPRLLAHVLQLSSEGEREDIELIERREGLRHGDIRAETLVHTVGAILRGSTSELFAHDNPDTFPDIFRRRLTAARDLFAL